jgi:hypothetical protein
MLVLGEGVNYPRISRVLCHLETKFQWAYSLFAVAYLAQADSQNATLYWKFKTMADKRKQ